MTERKTDTDINIFKIMLREISMKNKKKKDYIP